MIEKIQVGYTHVFLNNISVYHKYILYTDIMLVAALSHLSHQLLGGLSKQ